MAEDKKLSELPDGGAAQQNDETYALREGDSFRVTLGDAASRNTGTSANTIPVYKDSGRLQVGNGTDSTDAVNLSQLISRIIGSESSTNNAIMLYDGTDGKKSKDSGKTLTDLIQDTLATSFLADGAYTPRNLASRFGETANLLDFKDAGETNWNNALTRALNTGKPIEIPYNDGVPYEFTTTFTLGNGVVIRGKGKNPILRCKGTSQRLFYINNATDVEISNIDIDGDKINTDHGSGHRVIDINSSSHCFIYRVNIYNSTQCFQIAGTSEYNRIEECSSTDIDVHGVVLSGENCKFNTVTRHLVRRCLFGVLITNGANHNEVSFCRTQENGIELIGLTFLANNNRIIANHAEGCGDNGISITGFENTVLGNICYKNKHSGISIYGRDNAVVANVCMSNGQRFLDDGIWNGDGINLAYSWGGLAYGNTVTGNICGDDQVIKSQRAGISLTDNGYLAWAAGRTININNNTRYCYVGLNLYYTTTNGVTGSTEPTHTSGTVSDGAINWTYFGTAEPAHGASRNYVSGNIIYEASGNPRANRVIPIQNASTCPNTVDTQGYISRENGLKIYFPWNVTNPNGSVAGNIGDLCLPRSPTASFWQKTGDDGGTSGWTAIGGSGSLSWTNATRPLAFESPNVMGFNTSTGLPEWSNGSIWMTPQIVTLGNGIDLDYNYGTNTYRENGASVLFSSRHTFARSSTEQLRSAYPSTTITDFGTGVVRRDSRGVALRTVSRNFFTNSLTPVTKAISLDAGSYTLDIVGTGSATLSGDATGTATDQNAIYFVLANAGVVTVTITGSVQHVNLLSTTSTAASAGVFCIDPIVTSGSSRQSNFETLSLDVEDMDLEVSGCTIIFIARTPRYRKNAGNYIVLGNSSSNNPRYEIRNSSGAAIIPISYNDAGTQSTGFPTRTHPGQSVRFGCAVSILGNQTSISIGGGASASGTLTQIPTVAMNKIWIGSNYSFNAFDGFIERLIVLKHTSSGAKLEQYSNPTLWDNV